MEYFIAAKLITDIILAIIAAVRLIIIVVITKLVNLFLVALNWNTVLVGFDLVDFIKQGWHLYYERN